MIVAAAGWWIKPALIGGGLLVLAAAYGGQAWRISRLQGSVEKVTQQRDTATQRAHDLAADLATSEQRRKADQATAAKAQKEADDATRRTRETTEAADAAGRAHDAAVQRLRDRLAAATAGRGGGSPSAHAEAGGCQAADQAAGVFAEVLGRCAARVRLLADFADRSHDAATAGWEAWPVTAEVTAAPN